MWEDQGKVGTSGAHLAPTIPTTLLRMHNPLTDEGVELERGAALLGGAGVAASVHL